MNITTIPNNCTHMVVKMTKNFDSAYMFYLLAKKIAEDDSLNPVIIPALISDSTHEAIEARVTGLVVEYMKAAFPNVNIDDTHQVRYDNTVDKNRSLRDSLVEQHQNSGVDMAQGWLSTIPDDSIVVMYNGDCEPLTDENFDAMEAHFGRSHDHIRALKGRPRINEMPWKSKGTTFPIYHSFINENMTRLEVYGEMKELGLNSLIDNTISCSMGDGEATNNYTQPCGVCYYCDEKAWIKLQHA